MADVSNPELVEREYASLDRLANRRLDRTGWIRGVEEISLLLGAIAEAHPRRILDAGCGSGEWAALLTAPKVVCVDRSQAAVEAARARGLDASRADIQSLPFAAGSFDVVMCNWVLYHLDDLDRGLDELARVLRPGGRFVGCYNREGHLDELWACVDSRWPSDAFDGHNGAEALRRHFASVERRDAQGDVLWEDRQALQAYLDAYRELLGHLTAPDGPYPFHATRRNCVFVADKASDASP